MPETQAQAKMDDWFSVGFTEKEGIGDGISPLFSSRMFETPDEVHLLTAKISFRQLSVPAEEQPIGNCLFSFIPSLNQGLLIPAGKEWRRRR